MTGGMTTMVFKGLDGTLTCTDWCLACHAGRGSSGMVVNHPVDAAETHADPFDYGRAATDNPRFQNFPHEAVNYRMLVTGDETGYSDQLCMNCHPPSALP